MSKDREIINTKSQHQFRTAVLHKIIHDKDFKGSVVNRSSKVTLGFDFDTGEIWASTNPTSWQPHRGERTLLARYVGQGPDLPVDGFIRPGSHLWYYRRRGLLSTFDLGPTGSDTDQVYLRRDLGEFARYEAPIFGCLAIPDRRLVAYECQETCDPSGVTKYYKNVIRECFYKIRRSPSPVEWYNHGMNSLILYLATCKAIGCKPDLTDVNLHLVNDSFFQRHFTRRLVGKEVMEIEPPPPELRQLFTALSDGVYESIKKEN